MAYVETGSQLPSPYHNNNGVPPQPIQYVTAQPTPQQMSLAVAGGGKYGAFYLSRASIGLGVALIFTGSVSFMAGIFAVAFHANGYVIGTGVWCGAIFIITGSVAISAGHHLLDPLILTTTVFSFICMAAAVVQTALAVAGLIYDNKSSNNWDCPFKYCYDYSYWCICNFWWMYGYALASHYMLISNGLISLALGVALAAFTCKAVCDRSPTENQVIYVPVQQSGQNQTMLYGHPSQQTQVPGVVIMQQQQQQQLLVHGQTTHQRVLPATNDGPISNTFEAGSDNPPAFETL